MINHPSEDTRVRVLRALEENLDISQRALARDLAWLRRNLAQNR